MNLSIGCMRAPTEILFGEGQRHAIGKIARKIGRRVLVCTDRRLGGSDELPRLLDILKAEGVQSRVYSGTEPELPLENIVDCCAEFKKYQPDLVVGLGGGSCMDLAKLVSLLMAHGGNISEYAGELRVPGPVVPVVAIPTTAGTGSEVTPVAVYADKNNELKTGVSSPFLIPQVAICDPELTYTCPPGLTAIAGADALTHAIEAYTALKRAPSIGINCERVFIGKNVISDNYALNAIAAVSLGLADAFANGNNRKARSRVMLGAMYAGLAFSTAGTAAAHAIQYPLGAATATAHGAGVAALLPYVMDFNRPACETEFAEISRAMGGARELDNQEASVDAIVRVRTLFNDIGIPQSLAAMNLPESKIEWVVQESIKIERLILNNPRELTLASLSRIVDAAFHGRMVPMS